MRCRRGSPLYNCATFTTLFSTRRLRCGRFSCAPVLKKKCLICGCFVSLVISSLVSMVVFRLLNCLGWHATWRSVILIRLVTYLKEQSFIRLRKMRRISNSPFVQYQRWNGLMILSSSEQQVDDSTWLFKMCIYWSNTLKRDSSRNGKRCDIWQ